MRRDARRPRRDPGGRGRARLGALRLAARPASRRGRRRAAAAAVRRRAGRRAHHPRHAVLRATRPATGWSASSARCCRPTTPPSRRATSSIGSSSRRRRRSSRSCPRRRALRTVFLITGGTAYVDLTGEVVEHASRRLARRAPHRLRHRRRADGEPAVDHQRADPDRRQGSRHARRARRPAPAAAGQPHLDSSTRPHKTAMTP